MNRAVKVFFVLVVLAGCAALGWAVLDRLQADAASSAGPPRSVPAPVEVAPVTQGAISERRVFTGTLEAPAEFAVAPKVGGRIDRLAVDVADTVRRGQVVAWLDDDEFVQAVLQEEAGLAVAKANLVDARNALEIAERALARTETLRERGVATEADLDAAMAEQLAQEARVEVAGAQVSRAEAALKAANIRLGYTKVVCEWRGGDEERVVARRHVDEGDTVSANARLLDIVELDPLTGVIYATERDYARMRPGQTAALTTDAYPGEEFQGKVSRIAPVFDRGTRQARIELIVKNPDHRLKPGMFIRTAIVLERVPKATIVPESALTRRGGGTGVFVVDAGGGTVTWRKVKTGIREAGWVQVDGEGLTGRVVTLGQQLLDDGSAITIPDGVSGGGAAGAGAGDE